MFLAIDDNDSSIREDHLYLDKIVDAETMESTQKTESSKEHDG